MQDRRRSAIRRGPLVVSLSTHYLDRAQRRIPKGAGHGFNIHQLFRRIAGQGQRRIIWPDHTFPGFNGKARQGFRHQHEGEATADVGVQFAAGGFCRFPPQPRGAVLDRKSVV